MPAAGYRRNSKSDPPGVLGRLCCCAVGGVDYGAPESLGHRFIIVSQLAKDSRLKELGTVDPTLVLPVRTGVQRLF